ncbi:hypothetical protein DWW23_16455 [Parabacteroides sp. AF14-59]|nr:hypothetical protein DWW23_16455 [Parabacteroides sp. AF14-59]
MICCETCFLLSGCFSVKFNRGFEFLHFHCGNFSGLNFVNLLKITNFGRFEKNRVCFRACFTPGFHFEK